MDLRLDCCALLLDVAWIAVSERGEIPIHRARPLLLPPLFIGGFILEILHYFK